MTDLTLRHRIVPLLTAALLGAGLLTGCSSDSDTAAVCSDADSLQQSLDQFSKVTIGKGTLDELKTDLSAVEDDFTDLKSSAEDEFSEELSAMGTALDSLKDSLSAAVSDPNLTTVAAVSTAAQGVVAAAKDLDSAVETTCKD